MAKTLESWTTLLAEGKAIQNNWQHKGGQRLEEHSFA